MFTGARSHSMTSCLLIQTLFTLFQHPPPIKWPIIRPTREMGRGRTENELGYLGSLLREEAFRGLVEGELGGELGLTHSAHP